VSQPLTVEALEELEQLEKAAVAGPWRAGRSDTTSYTGGGLGPYKNVYGPRNEPELHLGHAIPLEEAQGWGDHCIENAQLIAAARNALPQLIESARRYLELTSALEFLEGGFRPIRSLLADDIISQARECGWQGAKP
jgi:hypothetical protein